MKRHIVEKNGFPKPLGMLIIMAVLVISCFINLALVQSRTSEQVKGKSTQYEILSSDDARIDG